MRHRSSLILSLALLLLVGLAPAAAADHDPPAFSAGVPASTTFNSGGEGAEWELISSFPTGNMQTDLEVFEQGGEKFVSAGTLGVGLNGAGQTIVQLTEEGEVNPSFVSGHPSATCITDPNQSLGLQHDVEAAPKGEVILNTDYPGADSRDAQLIVDATDNPGRCHDQGEFGIENAPQGGLEIVDVTDIENPVEIGLTSHIGEAHTVNIDPRRPHIAYAVTSDSVSVSALTEAEIAGEESTGEPVGEDGEPLRRENEREGDNDARDLDGFEVVDMSSCMNFAPDTPVEDKREQCQPEVFRYRFPTLEQQLGHTSSGSVFGCHELEVYPNDTLSCGGGQALQTFDISGAFNDQGTPDDFSDDTLNGTPLDCRARPSSTLDPEFDTGATVIDCVNGGTDDEPKDLAIPAWLADGAPSLEGIEHIGTAYHQGRGALEEGDETRTQSAFESSEDIDFDHEAEYTASGRLLLATDERGGGVIPPGATCSPGIDNPDGNGGIHAYKVDELYEERPENLTPEQAFDSYAKTPEGDKAIFRVQPNTFRGPEATFCTAHVFQQIPGQNRIFMAWYTQGTRVLDLIEHPDGTVEFKEAGFFVPEGANQWASEIFQMQENEDGTFTYFGVASDFSLTTRGRNAIDIYKVTLPAPPEPLPPVQDPGTPPGTEPPVTPPGGIEVVRAEGGDRTATSVGASSAAFQTADTVVVGRDDDYADSLSGGPLAARLDGPLLLTDPDSLSSATAGEIDRLGAREAVILGGVEAVSAQVEQQLRDAGLSVRRVFGSNRFATSVAVADELGAAHDSVVLAEGFDDDPQRGWPDAVAASAEAAATGTPILLAVTDSLPGETDAALDRFGVTETVLVGGETALDAGVEQSVADHGARRVFGDTRYGTSAMINREALDRGQATETVWLAKGTDWADALTGGPAAAQQDALQLLVDPTSLDGSAETRDLLAELAGDVDRVVFVGGDAISTAVQDDVIDLLTPDSESSGGAAGAPAGTSGRDGPSLPTPDAGLLLLAATLLPAAALAGRRRRTTATTTA